MCFKASCQWNVLKIGEKDGIDLLIIINDLVVLQLAGIMVKRKMPDVPGGEENITLSCW